jgi:nickel/cobalt exporter
VGQAEKDKLRALLEYWVKHNKEHGEEFREWAEKAKNFGETAIHDELIQAYEEMGKANVLLLSALSRLKKEEHK